MTRHTRVFCWSGLSGPDGTFENLIDTVLPGFCPPHPTS